MRKFGTVSNAGSKRRPLNYYTRSEGALEQFKREHWTKPTLADRFSRGVRGIVSFAGVAFFVALFAHDQIAEIAFPAFGCSIKGNISINSGAKIFHVKGQARYAETRIRHIYGERWFCSEADARAAGWRKAGI
jgi:hypothetical protein